MHIEMTERFVIFNEELAGGRARVTAEEVRVQRESWRKIVIQTGGLSGCKNPVCKKQ